MYAETRAMRPEDQAQRKIRKDIKTPPANWRKLKYLVNTYVNVIMLRTLFSKFCPHYQSVWTLRESIVSMSGEQEQHFSRDGGHFSKLLVWHILKDLREFFSVELMPSDFEDAGEHDDILWPISFLTGVATELHGIRRMALETDDFPTKWRDTRKQAASEQNGRESGGPRDWRGNRNGDQDRGMNDRRHSGDRGHGGRGENSGQGNHDRQG